MVVDLSSNPVIPGVRSIGPDVCLSWLMADLTVADNDANPIPTHEANMPNVVMPVAPTR